jgi:hypothetical protein
MATIPSWRSRSTALLPFDPSAVHVRLPTKGLTTGGLAGALAVLVGALAASACDGVIGPAKGTPQGSAGASVMGSAGTTGTGTGSGGAVATGTAGTNATGVGGSASGTAGAGVGGTGGAPVVLECNTIAPGRSPLRRLTTYEYNNTIRDLLGDTTNPGSALPAQVDSKQNPFGNDADEQSPTDVLVEKYQTVAESIAARATANATALGRLHSCASNVTAANEEGCARMIATALAPRALRRAAATAEIDELVTLYRNVRALGTTTTFASGVAAIIEALLQAPEFLYRVELGATVTDNAMVKRVAGREMATRLSYMFWQTMPDPPLFQAADAGMLDTKDGVLTQAKKMLDDPRSHPMMAFFFDNLLPIPDLSGLTRDTTLFPTWSASVGAAMRTEVQRFLEYEIYENTTQSAPPYAAGSWPAILTAPYTFVNQALFTHYGASAFAAGTTVTGTALTKVNLNTSQRLGLLTLGGMGAGSTTSNLTNPVLRGLFVINKLMCRNIELPTGFTPMAPDPYSGKTARERYSKHSSAVVCANCHQYIDPLGFPFENFDAVGRYRASERWTDRMTNMTYDTAIDASGSVPGVAGTAANAVELVQLLATSPEIESCFSSHWLRFAYGRSLESADGCNQQTLLSAFKDSGYNVKQLLLALTQSDGFLYRPAQ